MKKLVFFLLLLFVFVFPHLTFAQDLMRGEQFEAEVESVENKIDVNQQSVLVHLKFLEGRLENQDLTVTDSVNPPRTFTHGDRVIVGVNKNPDGSESYYISDYVRRFPLYLLFGLFVGLVLFIARKKGLAALLGMVATFGVIFFFVLPFISQGYNPIFIATIASIFIIPLTFYSSHGIDRKTTAAVLGTFIALILTGILAVLFVEATKLSGYAAEEAAFVKAAKGDLINIKGLLLAGMMIGILGVLDDITVAQANVVYQLKMAANHLSFNQLYMRAMEVGKDHIASMVNTLILVYTGASLPLLLLFINNAAPFSEVINYEIVAEEVVKTLVASIGLVLAVPITTYLSALLVSKD